MPLIGLYCSKTNKKMSLEEGIDYFEEVGAMPAEAVIAIINDCKSHEGKHGRMSPSMCSEETTCRRQIVLERFVGYYLDPMVIWEAREGQLFHDVFQLAGEGLEGWSQEVTLPPDDWENRTVYTYPLIDDDDGKQVYEVFPGVFMRGRLDKLKNDSTSLTDFKTSKYPRTYGKALPKKDYGEDNAQKDWPIQLGIYRKMVEFATGIAPKFLWVWRLYRGSHERSLTWRKFEVPIMHINTIWKIIGDFVTSTLKYLEGAMQIVRKKLSHAEEQHELKMYAASVPPDGYDKKMFYGQKCYKWCAVREECFKLMGKTEF